MVTHDEKFVKMMKELERVSQENPKWAGLLFDREYEQLFYGLFS